MTTTDELMKLSCVYAAAWTDSDRQATHAYDALRAAIESLVKERDALKAALAEPAAEPVAWGCFKDGVLQLELIDTKEVVGHWIKSDEPEMQGMKAAPLYTAAQPPRAPLTTAQIEKIHDEESCLPDMVGMKEQWPEIVRFARAIEKAHGIKESE